MVFWLSLSVNTSGSLLAFVCLWVTCRVWFSMVIRDYPWLSVVIHGFLWLSLVIWGYPWKILSLFQQNLQRNSWLCAFFLVSQCSDNGTIDHNSHTVPIMYACLLFFIIQTSFGHFSVFSHSCISVGWISALDWLSETNGSSKEADNIYMYVMQVYNYDCLHWVSMCFKGGLSSFSSELSSPTYNNIDY